MLRRLFGFPRIQEVSPLEAQERIAAGAQLIDVREPDEWRAVRIPGTRLIPLDELPRHLSELDPQREYILVCRSGNRSAYAAALLQRAGFRQVLNLAGGIIAWARAGLPLER